MKEKNKKRKKGISTQFLLPFTKKGKREAWVDVYNRLLHNRQIRYFRGFFNAPSFVALPLSFAQSSIIDITLAGIHSQYAHTIGGDKYR